MYDPPSLKDLVGAVRVFLGIRPKLRRIRWDHEKGPARFVIRIPGEEERWVAAETEGGESSRLDAWIDFELDGADEDRTLAGIVTVRSARPMLTSEVQ